MFFLYRAIILSVNSRLPVPVCMFVLVTHLIHRTCVTSRCQMNFYRCPVHYGIYILFTTPTNALFIKLGKGKIDIALHIFIASTFFRSSTILRELVQSLAEVIISAKTFSKIMSSYIVWRCGKMLHVMFFLLCGDVAACCMSCFFYTEPLFYLSTLDFQFLSACLS